MSNELLPPIKVAVLIDGGFFVKRFNSLYNKERKLTGEQVANALYAMAHKSMSTLFIDIRYIKSKSVPLCE